MRSLRNLNTLSATKGLFGGRNRTVTSRPKAELATGNNSKLPLWAVKTMKGRGLSRSSIKVEIPSTRIRPGSLFSGSKSNSLSRKTYSAASRPMLPQSVHCDGKPLLFGFLRKGARQIVEHQLVAAGFRPHEARQPVGSANSSVGWKYLQQIEKVEGKRRNQPLPEMVQLQDDPRNEQFQGVNPSAERFCRIPGAFPSAPAPGRYPRR